jgi:hypothetical protein
MVGGGMLALANFIIVVVTVIRKQKYLLAGYISAAVCAGLFSEHIVRNYGVHGACILYTGLMTIAAAIFTAILVISVRREIRNKTA